MKILFITGLYPKESEPMLRNMSGKVGLSNAANAFQWSIIEGLFDNGADFEVVSYPFLVGYPRFQRMYSPKGDIMYKGRKIGVMQPYNTFFLIKDLSKRYRLRHFVSKWLKANYCKNEKIVLMTYTPASCFIPAIIPFKKKYPNLEICSIIADLVDDMTNPVFHLSFPKYLQAKLEQRSVWASYKYIDKFVLLAEAMSDKIPQSKNNHIVVEGISNKVPDLDIPLKYSTQKTLLYAGAIQQFTGILDLVEAFKKTTNSTFRLIICGGGDCQDKLKTLISDDSRIEYKGILSRDEVLTLQKKSTALINPRKPNISLTKYSFPSKTMEYLASGTPMIGYQLDGIPTEYYPYIFTPKDLSNTALTECIDTVLTSSPEMLRKCGKESRDFIKNNKEGKHQVEKIIKYLEL